MPCGDFFGALPRGTTARELSAQGYRDDETWVGRTTLAVSDL